MSSTLFEANAVDVQIFQNAACRWIKLKGCFLADSLVPYFPVIFLASYRAVVYTMTSAALLQFTDIRHINDRTLLKRANHLIRQPYIPHLLRL